MKKYLFLILTLILTLESCDNVLDKEPLGMISDPIVWSDPSLIDSYLANSYDLSTFINDIEYDSHRGWANGPLSRAWFPVSVITNISDECAAGWEPNWETGGYKPYDFRVDNCFNSWWAYPLVRELNYFIEKIAVADVDEDFKKQRTAEARFLRAFAYFNMVKRYGGVPLITKVQNMDDPQEELYPKRDKEAAVYDFIISECDATANDLQEASMDDGRPTKYAALALKCRAALYAGSIAQWGKVQLDGVVGIPAGRADEYYQASYDAANAIIGSGNFSLYNNDADKATNYRNIFMDENNQEVIFSEMFDGPSGKFHGWDLMNEPYGYHPWGCGGQSCAYLETAEAYEYKDGTPGIIDRDKIENGYLWSVDELFGNKDPRFHASLQTQGSVWLGDTLQVYKGIIKEDGTVTEEDYKGIPGRGRSANPDKRPYGTPFMMLKYLDESLGIVPTWGTSKNDWIVFRLGEIILNKAEAAYELNKPGEALQLVNQIRDRAGVTELTSIDRDKIRHERRIELAFEAHRWWDVRRWRIAEDVLSKPLSNIKFILDYKTHKFRLEIIPNHDGEPTPKFLERNYYYPLTLELTNNNPNLVENPGYQ